MAVEGMHSSFSQQNTDVATRVSRGSGLGLWGSQKASPNERLQMSPQKSNTCDCDRPPSHSYKSEIKH